MLNRLALAKGETMYFFQAVVMIVLIGAAVKIVGIVYASKSAVKPQAIRDLEQRLEKLEKRIENVETITTSKDYELNKSFEELVKS